MKTLLLTLILLLPAFSVIGQETEYDKFKDQTHIFVYKDGSPATIWSFKFQGQTLTKDIDTFYVYFKGRDCRGFCFNNPSLIFLLDGSRLNLSDDEHRLSDSVIFTIDRPTMQKIVNSKVVEYQVGNYEGELKDDIKNLKNLFDLGTVKN